MIQVTQGTINYTIIELEGRIDTFSAPGLRENIDQLLEQEEKYFVVDLAKATFLDSAGLAVLVQLLKRARSNEGDVKIILPEDKNVRRIFELTRFDRVFDIIPSKDLVLKGF